MYNVDTMYSTLYIVHVQISHLYTYRTMQLRPKVLKINITLLTINSIDYALLLFPFFTSNVLYILNELINKETIIHIKHMCKGKSQLTNPPGFCTLRKSTS